MIFKVLLNFLIIILPNQKSSMANPREKSLLSIYKDAQACTSCHCFYSPSPEYPSALAKGCMAFRSSSFSRPFGTENPEMKENNNLSEQNFLSND
jgi:hypothetical protein